MTARQSFENFGSFLHAGELIATAYPRAFARVNQKGKKLFYIRYRTGGRGSKEIREPVGKSSAGMTAAKASRIRADRINGKEESNHESRRKEEEEKGNMQSVG